MGVNWLVTGGCGFIGLNLVKNLIKEGGHYIRIVDNLSVGSREDLTQSCELTELEIKLQNLEPSILSPQDLPHSLDLDLRSFHSAAYEIKPGTVSSALCTMPGKVDLIVADILDDRLALKAAQGIDVIVHLAANTGVTTSVEDPRSDCLNNIVGTINYLEAARFNNVKRFVFASSSASVGECEPPIHEEVVPHPISPYGASKLSGEAYCSAYFQTFGVETVVLRFGNVYGPLSRQKNSVVAKFIKRIMEDKPLEIYGDGKQTRDFIYIDDIVQAIRFSSTVDRIGGETFQVATNMETSVENLTEKLLSIIDIFGLKSVNKIYTETRRGDMKRNFSDTSKAQKHLGWHSEFELSDGLKRTFEWFLEKR